MTLNVIFEFGENHTIEHTLPLYVLLVSFFLVGYVNKSEGKNSRKKRKKIWVKGDYSFPKFKIHTFKVSYILKKFTGFTVCIF